ncbi:MAG TPA: hypothetical protein VGG24_02270 [Paraburkholderia sp.]|jgi:type VI secretion system protein
MTETLTRTGAARCMRRDRMRRVALWLRVFVLGLFVAQTLTGCAMLGLSGDKVSWSQMRITASDDMNDNSPISVDVVLVSDKTLLARLAEMPASKWFASRQDLVNAYPKGIRYLSWEVVPGQRLVVPGDVFSGPRVAGAFVFADYPGPGAHSVRLDNFKGHLVVQLNGNAFTASTSKND